MFNSIKDAIILVQDYHIKFKNIPATVFFSDTDLNDSDLNDSEIEIPFFYFFQGSADQHS